MDPELKKTIEEIKSLVHQTQEKNNDVIDGKADKETVEKMSAKFAELSEQVQKDRLELESEKKARESLELVLSKLPSGNGNGEIKSAPEYIAEFDSFLRTKSAMNPETVNAEYKTLMKAMNPNISDADMMALKSMIVGSNPDGGYLVPVQQNMAIIKRLFETSPMRSLASVQTCTSEAMEFIIDDGEFGAGWVGETDTRGVTDTSKLGVVTIPINEIYAQPIASQKFLDDALTNVESWLSGKVSDKFARTENAAFVAGDGIKKPTGITSYDAWTTAGQYERGKLETRVAAATTAFTADELIELQSDLLSGYNGVWAMHRKTWAKVLQLKDTDGTYLLNPAMLFSGPSQMQLLGSPVTLFNDLAVPAASAIPILYGDFRAGYQILDRIGIRVIRDPFTLKGYVQFYTTKRTGGAVTNFQAIKRLKMAAA